MADNTEELLHLVRKGSLYRRMASNVGLWGQTLGPLSLFNLSEPHLSFLFTLPLPCFWFSLQSQLVLKETDPCLWVPALFPSSDKMATGNGFCGVPLSFPFWTTRW